MYPPPPVSPETPPYSSFTLAQKLKAYISLQQVDSLGPIRLSKLLSMAGSIERLFSGSMESFSSVATSSRGQRELERLLRNPPLSPQWEVAERTIEWLAQAGAVALLKEDVRFPPLLKELTDCPPLIYLQGDVDTCLMPSISIVGTRKPTSAGRKFAADLAADLIRAGVVVTSGMAIGIDTAAHRGAINAGGKTVSVWATGLDLVYPIVNQQLAGDIIQNGCVLTEMPLGTPSLPAYFPRRNRIVSGLSLGVIVVEAALPSGSLITAGYAAEQNREVFAVPGSVYNPQCRGCHQLIKEGAALVESAEDVLAELDLQIGGSLVGRPLDNDPQSEIIESLSNELREIYILLEIEPIPFEIIANQVSFSVDSLSAALIELELMGLLSVEGGFYSRRV